MTSIYHPVHGGYPTVDFLAEIKEAGKQQSRIVAGIVHKSERQLAKVVANCPVIIRGDKCSQCGCDSSVYGCFIKDGTRSICKSVCKKTMKCVCMGCGWRGELPIIDEPSECPQCGSYQLGDAEKCQPSGKGL